MRHTLLLCSILIVMFIGHTSTTMAQRLPDLLIEDISYSPKLPQVDENIRINVVVKNVGALRANNSVAAIFFGNERVPALFKVPQLEVGEIHKLSRTVSAVTAGIYKTIAISDYGDKLFPKGHVVEANESNNRDSIIINIKSRPKSDLIVQSFTLNKNPFRALADTAIFTAVVRNDGEASTDTCRIAIGMSNEVTPLQFIVPPIVPGGTFMVKRYKIYTPSNIGTHQAIVYADYYDSLTEESETNNTDTINFTVEPEPRSDFVIQSFTLNKNPFRALADTAIFTAVVRNDGEASTDTCRIAIGMSNELTPLQFIVPPIVPGGTFMVKRYKIYTPSNIGDHQAIVYADYYDSLTEESETNNTDTINFTVEPEPRSDFVIQSFTLNTNPFRALADTAIFTAVVRNDGEASTDTCRIAIGMSNEVTPLQFIVPPIVPGGTFMVKRYKIYTPSNIGTHQAIVYADYYDSLTEESETNNTDTINFTVEPEPRSDLVIQSFSLNKNPFRALADTAIFTAVVRNDGEASTDTCRIAIGMSNELTPLQFIVPPIVPGGTFMVKRYKIYTPSNIGTHQAIVYADYYDSLTEESETNNTDTINFTVEPEPRSDLVIQSFSLNNNPVNTIVDTVIFEAIVKNIGPATADTNRMAIRVGSEVAPLQFIVPPLDSGGTFMVKRYKIMTAPGTYECIAYADYYDSLTEESETNNTDTLILTVNSNVRPDLLIQSYRMTPLKPNIKDTITFTAVIRNAGMVASGSFYVSLRVGGENRPPRYFVSSLAAGATNTVTRKIVLSKAQSYLSEVIADINNTIDESNELNNKETLIFKIAPVKILSNIPILSFSKRDDSLNMDKAILNNDSTDKIEVEKLLAYPNPLFHRTNKIKFEISEPHSGKGTICIYDALGNIIKRETVNIYKGKAEWNLGSGIFKKYSGPFVVMLIIKDDFGYTHNYKTILGVN